MLTYWKLLCGAENGSSAIVTYTYMKKGFTIESYVKSITYFYFREINDLFNHLFNMFSTTNKSYYYSFHSCERNVIKIYLIYNRTT